MSEGQKAAGPCWRELARRRGYLQESGHPRVFVLFLEEAGGAGL